MINHTEELERNVSDDLKTLHEMFVELKDVKMLIELFDQFTFNEFYTCHKYKKELTEYLQGHIDIYTLIYKVVNK